MFNYYISKKQESQFSDLALSKQLLSRKQRLHRILNSRLSASYRARVDAFISRMDEKPVVMNEFRNAEVRFREERHDKILGEHNFYFKGFKREGDRIYQSLQNNRNLDPQPNKMVAEFHKFREVDTLKHKTLHRHELRFKAKTTLERVRDEVVMTIPHQIQSNYHKINMDESINNSLAKQLYPSLHIKTHFQAVTSIFNQNPLRSLLKAKQCQPELGFGEQGREERDVVERSKRVLEKCQVKRSKSQRESKKLRNTVQRDQQTEL